MKTNRGLFLLATPVLSLYKNPVAMCEAHFQELEASITNNPTGQME